MSHVRESATHDEVKQEIFADNIPYRAFIPVFSRIERLKKFVKAITRPSRSDLAPVRVKEVYRFEEIVQMFERYACIIKLYIWYGLHNIPKHVHPLTGLYH